MKKKRLLMRLGSMIPVIFAICCLFSVISDNNQSAMSIPRKFTIIGEYSIDTKTWHPYTEDSELSAFDGNLTIKGRFSDVVFEGSMLNVFCNHIGVSIYLNDTLLFMDAPSEFAYSGTKLLPSMCGKRWEKVYCPEITAEDEVKICLMNCHKYGNGEAYREALSNILVTPNDASVLENYLEPYVKPFETIGFIVLIIAIVLLGASISATILKSNMVDRLFQTGMVALFAGGYMLFDVMMVEFIGELLVVKTYGRQLCMMLTVYFVGVMIRDYLSGKRKAAATVILYLSAVTDLLIIGIAIFGEVLLFDMQLYWVLLQLLICPVFLILCVLQMRKEKKYGIVPLSYICMLVAFMLDIFEIGYSMYHPGICSKVVFMIVLFVYLLMGAQHVVTEHQASLKNKKLQDELENSRIAVMLSQIQPHFIYNTLGTIGEFCEEEPKKAADLVQKFSLYLRGNFTELDNPMPIRLSKELEHVKHYTDIEQIRFPDMKIEYEMKNDNFLIPALTIQPLVENAIKHGLMGLESGGEVHISTYETEKYYEVCVKDNGVGFDDSVFQDGKKHVGIINTRKRIESMCGGTLTIESKLGAGTTAVIRIPKESEADDSNRS